MTVYHSALSRADFSRQRDVFKLARRGNPDCRRLWDDFAREVPAMARLVVADVESEKTQSAKVAEKIDKRLRQAEKVITKNAKPKISKAEKKARDFRPSPDQLFEWQLSQWLLSDSPSEREAAREALRSRGVFA